MKLQYLFIHLFIYLFTVIVELNLIIIIQGFKRIQLRRNQSNIEEQNLTPMNTEYSYDPITLYGRDAW